MASPTDKLVVLLKDYLAKNNIDVSGMNEETFHKLVDLYKVRIKTLSEFYKLTDAFFTDDYEIEEKGVKKYLDKEGNKDNLKIFADALEALEDFSHEKIEQVCRGIADKRKLTAAQIIHPTRIAISGKSRGAGLFEMMEVMGKEKVLNRIRKAAK
jgi:glutamyl-tRNA synthetase